MTPTPRTDAIAHRGLGTVAYIAGMTNFARDLERKLAAERAEHEETASGARMLADAYSAERALADRLAETLANVQGDYAATGAILTQEVAESLAAWKEARKTTLDK